MRFVIGFLLASLCILGQTPNIEQMKGKTVLLFTPHPDDDAFCCGGTLALLRENGNKVYIVLYTNDFESPNVPIVINFPNSLNTLRINFLYGSSCFFFNQQFTVEDVVHDDQQHLYSDP